jgi:hypothetical protein
LVTTSIASKDSSSSFAALSWRIRSTVPNPRSRSSVDVTSSAGCAPPRATATASLLPLDPVFVVVVVVVDAAGLTVSARSSWATFAPVPGVKPVIGFEKRGVLPYT